MFYSTVLQENEMRKMGYAPVEEGKVEMHSVWHVSDGEQRHVKRQTVARAFASKSASYPFDTLNAVYVNFIRDRTTCSVWSTLVLRDIFAMRFPRWKIYRESLRNT